MAIFTTNHCLLCEQQAASSFEMFCKEHALEFAKEILPRQWSPKSGDLSLAISLNYQGAVSRWMRTIKSQALNPWSASTLALIKIILRHWVIELSLTGIDCVVPVPASLGRHWLGWPLSERIAQELALELKVPMFQLLKPRWSIDAVFGSQKTKSRAMRLAGPQQQSRFRWHEPLSKLDSRLRPLLVDDIVTTGASMSDAANCLRKKGLDCRWAFALAQTPLRQHPHQAYRARPTL